MDAHSLSVLIGANKLIISHVPILIAPAMSAAFAATIYTLTRYFVLSRKESTRAGLCASPIYWFTAAAILTMSIGEPLDADIYAFHTLSSLCFPSLTFLNSLQRGSDLGRFEVFKRNNSCDNHWNGSQRYASFHYFLASIRLCESD